MPIGLDGGLRGLLDPLNLFSRGGNNGVGTGMRPHPVHGDHGARNRGPDTGNLHGRGANGNPGGALAPGAPPAHAPPAPPIPNIPGLSPSLGAQGANHPVQHALNTAGALLPGGGPPAGPQAVATTLPMAPGTPAFTGGPGQPALPAAHGAHAPGQTSSALPMGNGPPVFGSPTAGLPGPAALAGAVVSQLARAMNHGAPPTAVQPNATANGAGMAGTQAGAAGMPGSPAGALPGAAGVPFPGGVPLPLSAHPAALRATDSPLVPRMPAPPGFQPASVPRALAHPVAAHAQTALPAQAVLAPPASAAALPAAGLTQPGTTAAQEARAAHQQAQVPGRTTQAGLQGAVPPGAVAAQQAVAGNPSAQAAGGTGPTGNTALHQAAIPLVAALAGGSTAVEARVALQGTGQERNPLHLEHTLANGHTADRGMRRSLRNRVAGVRASLLKMIGLSLLDTAHPRQPQGHTGQGADVSSGKGTWFALPWLFWLLAIVAYGCLALAMIVMVGSDAAGSQTPAARWTGALVLGCGVLAAIGAGHLVRRRVAGGGRARATRR